MTRTKFNTDAYASSHGGIALLELATDRAREWATKNVASDDWQRVNPHTIAVENRCILAICDAMEADGLSVGYRSWDSR